MKKIRKVAILGSGTMGAGIAAQLANAGIPSYLLDIVPRKLTDKEKALGLTEKSPVFRNRVAAANKALLFKSKPAVLMEKDDAELITVGNMEDNLDWLSECQWVVEVVPENIAIKKAVLQQIAPFIKPGTIVTSNTSSIRINTIAEDMPQAFKQYWLGTHFFNPVRYMKLLEIIPGKHTLPEVVNFMAEFGEKVLGKGIVWAKDTPAFVSNRLGNFTNPTGMRLAVELGLSLEEVDAITGTAIGRPGTGIFGLYDLVGLDIGIASVEGIADQLEDLQEKEKFLLPSFCYQMMRRGMLGNKTKGGFYKRIGKEKQVIDINTFEYRPLQPVKFASLDAAREAQTLPEKLTAFFEGDDKAAEFTWKNITRLFLYAASKIPEVADDIINLDRGLCWGYNHSKGPFEIWNGLDLEKYVGRLEAEGNIIPGWIKEMLGNGIKSFYKTEAGIDYYYSIPDQKYRPIGHKPEVMVLKELEGQDKVLRASDAGTLYDIGDNILCLEIHTASSTLNPEILAFMKEAQAELAQNWSGMVVANSGKNFCVGLDLSIAARAINEQDWAFIDQLLATSQDVFKGYKYSEKPVVMAIHGMTLGGGCEMAMQGSAIQALGETYMGLVEAGVGLIPAGGGLTETVLRTYENIRGTSAAPIDFINAYFQNIITGRVSGSAKEAQRLGYLRPSDGITLNPDYLISDAKQRVLNMIDSGYTAPVQKSIPAFGQTALALLKAGTMQMLEAGMISDYDWHVTCEIVDVMAGGEIIRDALVTEEYLNTLERTSFIGLCKELKTQERISHMLKNKKPLRN